jgi:hypothetical protein
MYTQAVSLSKRNDANFTGTIKRYEIKNRKKCKIKVNLATLLKREREREREPSDISDRERGIFKSAKNGRI